MRGFGRILLACWVMVPGLRSQTLHDVVASLSDRQRVIAQREQVETQLLNEHSETSVPLPSDAPIDWVGAGTNPGESAVNGLDVGGRIALLNQAVAEFDRIAPAFVNASVAELEEDSAPGTLEFYRAGDFPPLPRATPENHQEILRLLAQRVRALRVLLWPSAFEETVLEGRSDASESVGTDGNDEPVKVVTGDEGMSDFSWTPALIGASNLILTESEPVISVAMTSASELAVTGTYGESASGYEEITEPLRNHVLEFELGYPKRAFIRASAEGAEGSQIGGTVWILSRSRWHELSVDGEPDRFDPASGSFVIEGSGTSGEIALFAEPPEIGLNGTWVTTASDNDPEWPWLRKAFVPDGYDLKAASLIEPWMQGHSSDFARSYERNWAVGCRYVSLFQPDFSRGVDAASARQKLDSVSRMLADNSADGAMRLHPRPNLLYGIDIGPGISGAGNGMLTAGSMPDALENETGASNTFLTYGAFGDFKPVRRFDSTYALRFAGSAHDYHVVYDNNRLGRTQSLPQLAWPFADPSAPGGTAYDWETLYRDWDRPRIKQVVGRDLIADVTYGTAHYGGYTVTVYRRPMGAADPEPGQALSTDNLTAVRTWTFTKPGANNTAHPANAEELVATGTGGETLSIAAAHALRGHGAGWDEGSGDGWYDYTYALHGGAGTTAWWWYTEGTHAWTLTQSEGESEKWRKRIEIVSEDLPYNPSGPDYEYAVTVGTWLDGSPIGTLTSETLDPFGDASPSDWSYASAEKTIVGTPVPGPSTDRAYRYGRLAKALTIEFDGVQPDTSTSWNDHGLLASHTGGPWKTDGSTDGSAWKLTHQFNNQTFATEWFEFTGPSTLSHSLAPDGTVSDKGSPKVVSTEVETGTLTTGMPGLPHKVTNADDTATTFEWSIAADGSGSLAAAQGVLAGGSVTRGSEVTRDWNSRGFTTSAGDNLLLGGTLKISGANVPQGQFTDWGIPKKWQDDFTSLSSVWSFNGNRSLVSSITSPLGLTTQGAAFDSLGRPGSVSANGITVTVDEREGPSLSATVSGDASGSLEIQRDGLGRLLSSNTTWNDVVDNLDLDHGSSVLEVSRTIGPYGTHTSEYQQSDGSLQKAEGATLPFGGIDGAGLSVSGGLFVTREEILNEQGQGTGAFIETRTDALGRVREIDSPSSTGTGDTTTTITYSNPNSTLRRITTSDPTGRILITETDPFDSNGAVTRSGIDINGDGSLGATDRYTESVTKVTGGKVVTTLSVTADPGDGATDGMLELIRSEWTPSSGETQTCINGSEETITTEPNHAAKTITTGSTKGWSRTTGINNLGLPISNTLSGTGLPTTSLTPEWRADGSLEEVTFNLGGDIHTAAFHPDGRLTSLTAPGRGNILGGHTIANGTETLTIDGVTVAHKLNGTETDIGGSDIIGRKETLTPESGGFRHTVIPDEGGETDTLLNAAFSPTKKTYADDTEETNGYEDELHKTITLARSGSVALGYSADGAKDLISATWPQLPSGPFTIPAFSHGYTHNRSGQPKTITDPSGTRTLAYQSGRLASTTYNAGRLKGHEIIRTHDPAGRNTGTTLKRDGTLIHSVQRAPNGPSDQITSLASGPVKVVPQRDSAGRITGYQWGSSTGTFTPALTQTWQRGTGGRIEYAGSDVSGAPTFDYLINGQPPEHSFDARGRRLKCATTGGTWTWQYGTAGQLLQATHTAHGTFSYQFDGVGRRKNHNASQNWSDLLNRTTDWENTQTKTLTLTAHPDARLWLNGTEIPNFTGSHQATLGTTDPDGQWVSWETLAILEGQGEGAGNPAPNPLASQDAKAGKKGAVWIPPAQETLAYDAAGNRQSNSQWDYGWDAKNQLVRARTKSHLTAPHAHDITFTYDAEGRRTGKKISEYRNGSKVAEKAITFIWDGWELLHERHQTPGGLTTLERRYLWGPDIADGTAGGAGGLLLIREKKGNTTTDLIPLYDGSGHVVALTNLNKDLQATYAYGPFGEKIQATGPRAHTNPWRYATKYLDEETGLYYFGHRYYDPKTGQFLSRDPLGESESLNLYSYCHNDPVNNVDVLGLAPKWMTDEQGKAYDAMLLEIVRAGAYDANTHSTILSMMELDGILHGSGQAEKTRMSEYLSQAGSVATANPILVATIGAAADFGSGIISAIPGMGPEGDGATDGSNTNGMLIVDTLRANMAGIISIASFDSPVIQRSMGGFMEGYEAKYSYTQRSVAQGLVFVAPFVPKVRPALGALTSRVANMHPVFNPSFAGRPGFASGMVRSPLWFIEETNNYQWHVGSHGNMPSPRPLGMQSHHGVNSVWMEANVPGYQAGSAPAMLMLNSPSHNATRGLFNRFRVEIAARQGVSPRNINWSEVQPGTAWRLAEEQFEAAGVPLEARAEYFRQLQEYIMSLSR